MRVTTALRGLVGNKDDGQDLIEYALLASLIAVVAVGAVTALGFQVANVFWATIAASF
jgi:Flp pilus assembly pilin Flp